jgi:type IV secretory pathway VirJ component
MFSTLLLFAATIASLPVIEKPAPASNEPYFAVFLTGDGGWRQIDAAITEDLNARGIPVAGFLSNDYFSDLRTPAEVARDVESLLDHYAARWRKPKVILIGYSRGADAVPAILANLSSASRARIALAAMLGPGLRMELQAYGWWAIGRDPPSVPLLPLIRAARGVRLLCVHGSDEDESLCDALGPGEAIDLRMPGGHHFGEKYRAIADAIYRSAAAKPPL